MSEGRTILVVVTGLSGAGKSTAVHALEDVGFFCIDNLPTPGVRASLDALRQEGVARIALGMDVRVRSFLDGTTRVLEELERAYAPDLRVLFLDAADQALLRRFSSTRRPHPLSTNPIPGHERAARAVLEGIHSERELLSALRARASVVIDTTELSVHDLRAQVLALFGPGVEGLPRMRCRVLSFGFQYGPPQDADLVFDVRFLKNPFFVPELKPFSGRDASVRDYVLGQADAQSFLDHAGNLVGFCVPRFEREGKAYLTVALGCTGGRHRSVALAERLASRMEGELGMAIDVVHRDMERNLGRGREAPEPNAVGKAELAGASEIWAATGGKEA
ncbi:MAG TPA: RNase adapter RapZ [Polyangiaceae bacterium]